MTFIWRMAMARYWNVFFHSGSHEEVLEVAVSGLFELRVVSIQGLLSLLCWG